MPWECTSGDLVLSQRVLASSASVAALEAGKTARDICYDAQVCIALEQSPIQVRRWPSWSKASV